VRTHPVILGDFVAVTITDSGPGIPLGKIEQIFEPFFTTKGVGQGTGLGLSQVFGFAKQSGGDVIAGNETGGGARFTLYLPIADLPETSDVPEQAGRGAALGQGACVLVVEDNAEVGEFAKQALAELGYETVLATNAQAALDALGHANNFQAIFSDIVMPGMSGIELGEEIRRRYPELPVVLASGFSDALVQSGASGFPILQKPYSIDTLSRMLRTVFVRAS
jgi:CheY-like chemotaxis protein